ncbi:hypothetical protein HK105_200460 [Polyrhizophydium stewartii]|uniref:Uncharacterized protein n=1 Tax=Polyrhizophydium stewartii TaxID=2732419 RepID=A0ABR4NLI7_9FUNG
MSSVRYLARSGLPDSVEYQAVLDHLDVLCPYADNGCPWLGRRSDVLAHIRSECIIAVVLSRILGVPPSQVPLLAGARPPTDAAAAVANTGDNDDDDDGSATDADSDADGTASSADAERRRFINALLSLLPRVPPSTASTVASDAATPAGMPALVARRRRSAIRRLSRTALFVALFTMALVLGMLAALYARSVLGWRP